MNSEQFEKIIGEQIETCKGILLKKRESMPPAEIASTTSRRLPA